MPQHIGIVACSAEGAALCYRTICIEGERRLGPYGHPTVTLNSLSFGDYMAAIEKGDWQGVANMLNVMGVTSQLVPPHVLDFLRRHFIAGWGGYPLVGGKTQIVEGLAVLKKAGFDGILLTWPRWVEGMTRFRDEVMPLLREAGLR